VLRSRLARHVLVWLPPNDIAAFLRAVRGDVATDEALFYRLTLRDFPRACDAAGAPEFAPEPLAEVLAQAFASDTGWGVTPGEWTAEERERIPVIRAEKYANREWNEKR